MRKKIIIALVVVAAIAIVAYNYMYKSHRDISAEEVTYSETVPKVYNAFLKNDSLANAKYLDKTIEIYGKITNIDLANKIITVDEKLTARCTNSIPNTLKVQNTVTLKGRVVGYDDLVEEIQMDQCTIKQ
jgi:predicted negative regulator of RcsB-dependent stress response